MEFFLHVLNGAPDAGPRLPEPARLISGAVDAAMAREDGSSPGEPTDGREVAPMSSFGFVLHERLVAGDVGRTIEWLEDRGHQVSLPLGDADQVGRADLGVPEQEFPIGLDLVVSMGGDGTMLRSAALAVRENVPILGANLGTLGYLTEVDSEGLGVALKRFLSGAYRIEERMRLDVSVQRSDGSGSMRAPSTMSWWRSPRPGTRCGWTWTSTEPSSPTGLLTG